MTQGKCDECKIAWFTGGKNVKREKALCPKCGGQLMSTSWQLTAYPWRNLFNGKLYITDWKGRTDKFAEL